MDDPTTGAKIPTCHRTRPESILDDADFGQACELADPVAKRVFRDEAKAVDRIQRRILEIVEREEPCDVFICCKETDEDGNRTEDSVLAQEAYDSLTAKGLKVFFSRITLESKLGQEYEPYIYAALSSAKVMLAFGTQFDYFDAVWVKNEWSRCLDMMKSDKDKRLIPCYRGIDAYDMPREFRNLQGQDLGKLGWQQDLTRGVMKLLGRDGSAQSAPKPAQETAAQTSLTAQLKLGQMALEDGEFDRAKGCFEKALSMDAENPQAWLGCALAELCLPDAEALIASPMLDAAFENRSLQKAVRFGGEKEPFPRLTAARDALAAAARSA